MLLVVCDACRVQPVEAIAVLGAKLNRTETRLADVQRVCASCARFPVTESVTCESLDCPWLYERKKTENRAEAMQLVRDLIDDLEEDIEEAQTAVSACLLLVRGDMLLMSTVRGSGSLWIWGSILTTRWTRMTTRGSRRSKSRVKETS